MSDGTWEVTVGKGNFIDIPRGDFLRGDRPQEKKAGLALITAVGSP